MFPAGVHIFSKNMDPPEHNYLGRSTFCVTALLVTVTCLVILQALTKRCAYTISEL